jgi:hypothetical protein
VDAGDLDVPVEDDVVAHAAADRQPGAEILQRHDRLGAIAVAIQQVGRAAPLGHDPRLQLAGRRAVQLER